MAPASNARYATFAGRCGARLASPLGIPHEIILNIVTRQTRQHGYVVWRGERRVGIVFAQKHGEAGQQYAIGGEMILSTHAVVGGTIASLFPTHPILVATLSFASHFVIDAIPHWDYPLKSISVKPNANNWALKINRRLFRDLALIGFDACVASV